MIQNYKQTDPRWASMLIGQGSMTMAEGGCGVCAIADVVDVAPPPVAQYMEARGFIYPDAGTVHEGVVPTMQHYGVDGKMLTAGYINGQMVNEYITYIYDYVRSGYCTIFLMGGTQTRAGGRCRNDYWSRAGHYICICGAQDGKLLAHDPADPARDGWHRIDDYGGEKEDSYNGNIKKIWTTTARWQGGLEVDGMWGIQTTIAAQRAFGTTQDGIISNQWEGRRSFLETCMPSSWEFVPGDQLKNGSELVRRIQAKIGATVDGFFGPETSILFQRWLGVREDGYIGTITVRAFQSWLNSR